MKVRLGTPFWGLLLPATVLVPALATTSGSQHNVSLADDSCGDDWPAFGRTCGEQHFSPLAQIAAANVGRHGLAWSLDIDTPGSSVTGPTEVGGVLYFASAIAVEVASDLRTSPVTRDKDSFQVVLHDGVLLGRGMPQFDELTPAQLDDLRHYILAEADRAAKKPGHNNNENQ